MARPGLSSVRDQPAALQVSSRGTRLSLAAPVTPGPSHNRVTTRGLHAGRLDSNLGAVTAPTSTSSRRGIFHQEVPQQEPLSPFPAHPSPLPVRANVCVFTLFIYCVRMWSLHTFELSSLTGHPASSNRPPASGPSTIPRPASTEAHGEGREAPPGYSVILPRLRPPGLQP